MQRGELNDPTSRPAGFRTSGHNALAPISGTRVPRSSDGRGTICGLTPMFHIHAHSFVGLETDRKPVFVESKRLGARLQEQMAQHILAAEKGLGRPKTVGAARSALQDREHSLLLCSWRALERLYQLPLLTEGTVEGLQD